MYNSEIVNILDLDEGNHITVMPSYLKGRPDRKFYSRLADNRVQMVGAACDDYFAVLLSCMVDNVCKSVVRRFDWNGSVIDQYEIADDVFSISVSSDGHILYGITQEEVIYEYGF